MPTPEAAAERELTVALETRRFLLGLHGWFGLGVGLAMIVTGGPPGPEELAGPVLRLVLGAVAVLGGAAVLAGLQLGWRELKGWWCCRLGLQLLILFEALLFLSLSVVLFEGILDGVRVLYWPWEAVPRLTPRVYPLIVYLALTLFTLTHGLAIRAVRPRVSP